MRKSFASGTLDIMEAATTLANGAILIDEYDPIIFDDILRRYPAWNRIDRRLLPGGIETRRACLRHQQGFVAGTVEPDFAQALRRVGRLPAFGQF